MSQPSSEVPASSNNTESAPHNAVVKNDTDLGGVPDGPNPSADAQIFQKEKS